MEDFQLVAIRHRGGFAGDAADIVMLPFGHKAIPLRHRFKEFALQLNPIEDIGLEILIGEGVFLVGTARIENLLIKEMIASRQERDSLRDGSRRAIRPSTDLLGQDLHFCRYVYGITLRRRHKIRMPGERRNREPAMGIRRALGKKFNRALINLFGFVGPRCGHCDFPAATGTIILAKIAFQRQSRGGKRIKAGDLHLAEVIGNGCGILNAPGSATASDVKAAGIGFALLGIQGGDPHNVGAGKRHAPQFAKRGNGDIGPKASVI